MNDSNENVQVVALETILPLRWKVLRPGHASMEAARFNGDTAADTVHLAILERGEAVACLTCMTQEDPYTSGLHSMRRRLRGMAVAPTHQRTGLGKKLVEALITNERERGHPGLWCCARLAAIPFYAAQGFTAVSDEFLVLGVGPHKSMVFEC